MVLKPIRYLPSLQLQFHCTVCTATCRCKKKSVSGQSRNSWFTSAACCTHCTVELDLQTREISYAETYWSQNKQHNNIRLDRTRTLNGQEGVEFILNQFLSHIFIYSSKKKSGILHLIFFFFIFKNYPKILNFGKGGGGGGQELQTDRSKDIET